MRKDNHVYYLPGIIQLTLDEQSVIIAESESVPDNIIDSAIVIRNKDLYDFVKKFKYHLSVEDCFVDRVTSIHHVHLSFKWLPKIVVSMLRQYFKVHDDKSIFYRTYLFPYIIELHQQL